MRQVVKDALGYYWDINHKLQLKFLPSSRDEYIHTVEAVLLRAPTQSEIFHWAEEQRRKALHRYKYRKIEICLMTQILPGVIVALVAAGIIGLVSTLIYWR